MIGTILALIVLLGFGALFLVITDGSGSFGGENIHTQIKSKENSIRRKQLETKYWQDAAVEYEKNRKMVGELQEVERNVKLKQKQVESRLEGIATIKGEMVQEVEKLEEYKKQYRIAERERAVGEEYDNLTTKEGEGFEQVSIRRVSALGMEIRHKNGFKRIAYQNLPDEMQDRFQFSEDDAKSLASREKAAERHADRGKENYQKSVKEMRKRELLRQHQNNVAKWKLEIARAEALIHSNESAIRSAESRASSYRAKGNRGLNYDNAKKLELKADQLRKASQRAQTKISELQRKVNQPAPL